VKKQDSIRRKLSLFQLIGFGFIASAIFAAALSTLMHGNLHYENWKRQSVFAPFALVTGVLVVVLAIKGAPVSGGGRKNRRPR